MCASQSSKKEPAATRVFCPLTGIYVVVSVARMSSGSGCFQAAGAGLCYKIVFVLLILIGSSHGGPEQPRESL